MSNCPISISKWLEDNNESFKPPVMNKLMHDSELQVMFVGGPNIRDDYHLEEGEVCTIESSLLIAHTR